MATDSRTPMRYNQHAMDDRDTFTGGSEAERLDPMDEAYEAINKPPVATCPECDEYVWVELTELGICESCKDERCTLEVEQARNARLPGENNQSWVARCNEVLRAYDWTPDMHTVQTARCRQNTLRCGSRMIRVKPIRAHQHTSNTDVRVVINPYGRNPESTRHRGVAICPCLWAINVSRRMK